MTEEAISTDHARHAQEVEPRAKTDWMRATAESQAFCRVKRRREKDNDASAIAVREGRDTWLKYSNRVEGGVIVPVTGHGKGKYRFQ